MRHVNTILNWHKNMIIGSLPKQKHLNTKMYKERCKIEHTKYIISMNESMKSILGEYHVDYKSLLFVALPLRLSRYIERGIVKREDVNSYTYKDVKDFALYYPDSTGNEYTNNKVYIETNGGKANALYVSLSFAFAIANLLDTFSESFNIVLSCDGKDFIVSFYCNRDNEEWFADDLDSYIEEAIFFITTK